MYLKVIPEFTKDYQRTSSFQKEYNTKVFAKLIKLIQLWFPYADKVPIAICDLCCGDGFSTNQLLQMCDQNNIFVNKMTGVDISSQLINAAKSYEKDEDRITFINQDVSCFAREYPYDLVISMFGLHWIRDIKKVAHTIFLSLRKNGRVFFLVTLQKEELFCLRKKLVNNQKWKKIFKDFRMPNLNNVFSDYKESFSNYFLPEYQHIENNQDGIEFDGESFLDFLSSWLPEVHYLKKDALRHDYVTDLIETIPFMDEHSNELYRFNNGSDNSFVFFVEKYLIWCGMKN